MILQLSKSIRDQVLYVRSKARQESQVLTSLIPTDIPAVAIAFKVCSEGEGETDDRVSRVLIMSHNVPNEARRVVKAESRDRDGHEVEKVLVSKICTDGVLLACEIVVTIVANHLTRKSLSAPFPSFRSMEP